MHISALPGDYYHFDAAKHCLQGERSGKSFRLGDTIEVQVVRVDLDEKKIDFELADAPPKPKSKPKAKPKSKKANAEKSANSQAGGPLFDQKGKPSASAKKPRRKKTVPK